MFNTKAVAAIGEASAARRGFKLRKNLNMHLGNLYQPSIFASHF